MRRILLLALLSAGALACAPAAAGPARIVSLNLCADELVLRLADPGQVASVTYLSRVPGVSNVAELARAVPENRGLAEEIVPLKPDLVIVGAFTTATTTAMLRRLGLDVMTLPVPATLEAAYGQIRDVGRRIGQTERAEAMVARMKEAFAHLPAPGPVRPTAIVLRPNGFVAGRGSLADEILSRAGLDNLAARLSPNALGELTLEEIVAARPDLLIINAEPGAPPSLADALLSHPVLSGYAKAGRMVALPLRLWTCAGPELAEAARRLSDAARKVAREIRPVAAAAPSALGSRGEP